MRRPTPEPSPLRMKFDPIGRARVRLGVKGDVTFDDVPLLAVTGLGEGLVRLPDRDRWVPRSWFDRLA